MLLLVGGCALFDLFYTPPEFSVSGARVIVMPFKSPNSWYGEGREGRAIMLHATSILREGGAEICYDKTIYDQVVNFVGTGEPPWVLYGKKANADYVVVGNLELWKIGDEKAVNYCPGTARLHLRVYGVEEDILKYEKSNIAAKVGQQELDSMFHYSDEKTEQDLMKSLDRQLMKIFVGGSGTLE